MKKPVALLCALVCCASLLLPPALAEEGIVLDNSAFELEAPTSPPFVPEATPHVTLQKGSSGEAVMRLQQRLTELGFYYGKISGNFLDGTDAATRDFQQRYGLDLNGKVTATTWNAIMSRDALGKDGQKHAPADGNAYAVAQPTPPPVVVIGAEATPAPPDSGAVFGRKLQYDSQGEDVRALQSRLQALGYYNAEISGNFYGNTRDAVRAFQRQNALKVDGIVGEETHRTLWDDTLAINVWSTPRPTPTPVPPMYLLKVDVTNQVTTAYTMDEQGDYTVPFRRMICSTGTKSNPTPLNTTVSKGARARWGYFPEWGSHAQYLTRIDSKNAFHSVLYSEPDPMQLVVGAYNALGSRASHGCVRLLVEDAKWIYDNCPSGTQILIVNGSPYETKADAPPPVDEEYRHRDPTDPAFLDE